MKKLRAGEPLPAFKGEQDEARFWRTHEIAELFADDADELELAESDSPRPRAPGLKRNIVKLRLDDDDLARVKAEARRKRTSAAEIIRTQIRSLPAAKSASSRKK